MWLRLYKHLLPRAKAWQITTVKRLREFFDGLSSFPADIKLFVDQVWEDIFPATTRELDQWEDQFGLPDTGLTEQERRDRLDAAWKAKGGQDPTYIQETLQGAGFDVYVHEWWVPGSEPAVDSPAAATPRDPVTTLVAPAYALVNPITTIAPLYLAYFDGGALPNENQFGAADTQFGRYDELLFSTLPYDIPTDTATWPYFLYIGDAVFPSLASVPLSRKEEFEALCLKICPAQQWLGILVNYV
jgi:hypothetical protein